jgi:hypothetical protein
MNDVIADFVDISEIFEDLSNDSNVPFFRLYKLILWKYQLFLVDMLLENNLMSDSTYRVKIQCHISLRVLWFRDWC